MRNLLQLPKADLHCHLEGSARPETIYELAAKYHVYTGDLQDFNDLPEFLVKFEAARSVIRSIDDLVRIAREFILDTAASGGVYCEPDWAPHFFTELDGLTQTTHNGRIEEVFSAVNEAMRDAAKTCGIQFGHLMGASKSDPEGAIDITQFAVGHKHQGVVSFGFAGDERQPHEPFRQAVQIAITGGLHFVPHAGEVRGAESVAEVVQFGAFRVCHGIKAAEDPEVATLLRTKNIACDVVLSSNKRIGITRDLSTHPIFKLQEQHIPVTLGTDDSLFFGSSLLNEYELARSLGMSDDDLADIASTSIRFATGTDEWKRQSLERIATWLASEDV